ncbi:MAG: AhpC/TSA family protein, partial [Rhodomicrobium sp.]
MAAGEDGPLQERLDTYSAYSRELRPEVNQAYDELIARLSGLKKIGPSLGAQIPEFYLPDQDGHLVSLESLLSDGPLILSLNRGHWCPWCRL